MDQGSNKNHYHAYNFAPIVTKLCVLWEGLSLPHDTKFGNCRCEIVDSRAFPSWSLIHGFRWSGLIKAEPGSIIKATSFAIDATCVMLSFNRLINCIDFCAWFTKGQSLRPEWNLVLLSKQRCIPSNIVLINMCLALSTAYCDYF